MVVAFLCIIHCALFPVLIMTLPASRQYFDNIILESTILFLGILVGSISFTTSFKKHRKPGPLLLGLSGVAFLTVDLFVLSGEAGHVDIFGVESVHPLMILGGVLLIAGHAWNLRECHCFCDQSCSSEEHNHDHDHEHSAHETSHSPSSHEKSTSHGLNH